MTNKTHGKIETSFVITGSGGTSITATTGKGEYTSQPNTKVIKLDNIKPEITNIKITPEPGQADSLGKSWITVTGKITIEAEDSKDGNKGTGKVTGYEYTAKNLKTDEIKKTVKVEEITKGIDIVNDGEYQVDIQAIDEAGNKSETSTVNVYKDSEKPEVGELEITAENSDGFTMHLGATDDGSGIGKVECTVNGNKLKDEQVTIDQITEAGVTFTIKGLAELSSHTIFVKVYDNAGNPSTATKEITGETTAAMNVSLKINSTGATSVSLTATVSGNKVAISKYIFQKSTISSEAGFTDAGENVTTNATSTKSISTNEYTTYWFRVIVEDVEGHQGASQAVTTKTLMAGPTINVTDKTWVKSGTKTFTISTISGWTAYYTIDGTEPTTSSSKYTGSSASTSNEADIQAKYYKASTGEWSVARVFKELYRWNASCCDPSLV